MKGVIMSVERICQCEVDVAEVGETVLSVAERMRQRTVGCVVVLNDAQEPIGILTDRDLVVRVLADGKDPFATRVEEVMTKGPRTASEGTAIEEALGLMRSGAFRRLPVVDRKGKLIGILTLDDLLMLLAEEFTQVGQLLQRETPRAAALAC
jgi:CBS domain-containing protein